MLSSVSQPFRCLISAPVEDNKVGPVCTTVVFDADRNELKGEQQPEHAGIVRENLSLNAIETERTRQVQRVRNKQTAYTPALPIRGDSQPNYLA